MPAVSVVIPAYESPDLLAETVRAVLAQTFTDFEVVVVDDGSGPATRAALEPFIPRIRYLRQENSGPSGARNTGIAAATGDLVAFCDEDDLWRPEKLARHVARHRSDPELGLTFSQLVMLHPDGRESAPMPGHLPGGDPRVALLEHTLIRTCSAVVVRRDVLARAGPFDPALPISGDLDLWLRVAALARLGFVAEPLVRYRQHGASLSRSYELLHEGMMRVLDRAAAASAPGDGALHDAIRRRRVLVHVATARRLLRDGKVPRASELLREAGRLAPLSPRVRRHQIVAAARGLFGR